jgi:outer membrane protein assembly factor BamB
MSQDFVTVLRLQLREAAEREARRGPVRRALPQARPLALAGALAAALLAVAIGVAIGWPGGRDAPPPTSPAPHIVGRLAIADRGGTLTPGFGAVWAADPGAGRVLRLGPDGRVVATTPISGDLVMADTGAGAVWALTDARLVRIDPATNRVTARIALPPPTRSYGGIAPGVGVMWVVNWSTLLRIDPRTNTIDKRVSVEHNGLQARGIAADGKELYVLRRDGVLETLDAGTGARLRAVRPAVTGVMGIAASGIVFMGSGAGIAAVDSHTGRLVWRTNLGTSRLNAGFFNDRALWIQGTPVTGYRDQLWRLDGRTGRVTAALPLSDFGANGMLVTRGQVWIMSQAGVLTVIR